MKRLARIAIGLLVLSVGIQTSYAAELRSVGGAASNRAAMDTLAEAYNKEAGTTILVVDGGSTQAIREVAAGTADLGSSGRHKVADDEERNARLVPVGWDALVAITHLSNPVKNISKENLQAVFEGRITNWRELGGEDSAINLVVRADQISGIGLLVRELLHRNPSFDFPPNAIRVAGTDPAERRVERDSVAVAFTGISSARKRNVAILKIEGREPSYENIAAGRYDLVRPLYLVVPKDPPAEVAAFTRFATGPAGQTALKRQGTVTLADGAALWPLYNKAAKEARKAANF